MLLYACYYYVTIYRRSVVICVRSEKIVSTVVFIFSFCKSKGLDSCVQIRLKTEEKEPQISQQKRSPKQINSSGARKEFIKKNIVEKKKS